MTVQTVVHFILGSPELVQDVQTKRKHDKHKLFVINIMVLKARQPHGHKSVPQDSMRRRCGCIVRVRQNVNGSETLFEADPIKQVFRRQGLMTTRYMRKCIFKVRRFFIRVPTVE